MTGNAAMPQSSPLGPILPILSVNFVGTLGFSIVVPFMVFLVAKWGGNAIVYGLLASTYSTFQLIGAPVLGKWSDRYGRRKILLVSQLGTMFSWMVFLVAFAVPAQVLFSIDSTLLGQFAITAPLVILFFARGFDGLTSGNVSVANAYLADITEEADRSANFGRMAVSSNLGFVVGPALAGLLGASVYGEILPVATALLISVVASLLIAFGLKESRPLPLAARPEEPSACQLFGQENKETYRLKCEQLSTMGILKLPKIPSLLAVYFLVMLGFSFFYIAFPTHAAIGLEWSVTQTGIFFAVLSLLMVLVQGPLNARLSKVVPEAILISGGSLLLAAGFVLLLWENIAAIYAAAAFIALGNGLMWPTFMAVLSKQAGDRFQGAVQGLASSAGAIASIAGLIAGGLIYTWVGAWVFVVSAGIIALVALFTSAIGPTALPSSDQSL